MRILLLAGNTLRSRSYAQQLKHCKSIEVKGLFYDFKSKNCVVPYLNIESELFFTKEKIFIPDLSEPLNRTFEANSWDYCTVETNDVNSEEIANVVGRYDVDLIVFSGYGGQILKNKVFFGKIPVLHMHPGLLPSERGSTTIYYSILNRKRCSVTAFLMSEQIDSGTILTIKHYLLPEKGVNIDEWYDNIIRADCMISALEVFKTFNTEFNYTLYTGQSEEFYIIHPVLKHISLLSLC